MQKGLTLIAFVIPALIIAAVLFIPIPYYQKTDGWCESNPPQLCQSKGWHLRPSLWKEITGALEQTVSHTPMPSPSQQFVGAGCKLGGCNSEICQDEDEKTLVSPCVALPKFGCYYTARCEKQTDGRCGWTQTQELQACLEKFPD